MSIEISPGDIIILFDVLTTPPKKKWLCCICVAENWFLRINTAPRHHGFNLLISKSENPFLKHDSHIDFKGVIFKDPQTIQQSLENPENLIQ